MMPQPLECDPFSRTWLDRRLISADQDSRLHRAGRCPYIQLAAGRWQIASLDPDHTLVITSVGHVSPAVLDVLHRARPKQIAPEMLREILHARTASVRLGDAPWEAYDGSWILYLRPWVAIFSVANPAAAAGSAPQGAMNVWGTAPCGFLIYGASRAQ